MVHLTMDNVVDGDQNSLLSTAVGDLRSRRVLFNFILFSLFFSIAHATVDGVLAFASAELGPKLGGYSGFVLYAFYTLTALIFAKPFLRFFDAKYGVLVGLLGLLIYVASFMTSLILPEYATALFLTGAGIGGLGSLIFVTT